MKMKIIKEYPFSKVGLDEVKGLENAMRSALKPIQKHLEEKMYWARPLELSKSEYKGRDGFIPYSSNCGGLEISEHLPKCESYNFPFIDFGECWEPESGDMENHECDEHCDAHMRIWFKFEGIEAGKMKFYLYLGGGNEDAPYFRTKYEPTIFETEFSARNLTELKTKGKAAVKTLLKAMGAQ